MDCNPPGSSVHGILQARILRWVAIPLSRGSSQPSDWTWLSCTAGIFFTIWATREAQKVSLKREVRKGLWASFSPFPLLLTRPAGRGSGSCIPAWWAADPEQEYALRTVKGATLCFRKGKLSQARPRPPPHLRLQPACIQEFQSLGEDLTKIYSWTTVSRIVGGGCTGSKRASEQPPHPHRSFGSPPAPLHPGSLSPTSRVRHHSKCDVINSVHLGSPGRQLLLLFPLHRWEIWDPERLPS